MSAINQLREHLREAARRDIEAERARTRRVRRRAAAFLAAVLLGGAAAATAADLISVGEPVPDTRQGFEQFRAVGGGGVRPVVTAASGYELPFGVAIYTAKNGQRCAIAGEALGSSLGRVRDGKFRPYDQTQAGACGGGTKLFHDAIDIGDRTLVFGRAAPGAKAVTYEGTPHTPGPGGAFLFVVERVPPTYRHRVE
jgi:hypothetical protein